MLKIEIKSTDIDTFSGVSKTTQKPFNIRNQVAYAFTSDKSGNPRPYPEMIKISLEDDQLPFAPGMYILSPSSIYVDQKFGRLTLGRPSLVPVQNPVARAS